MKKGPQIFAGAVNVFAEKGFDTATMDEVAERAGVAKGTLYYHFSGKEELIFYLIQEGVEMLVDQLKRVPADGTPLERLDNIIESHVRFFEENRSFCKVLVTAIWSDSKRYTQFRQSLQLLYEFLSSILDEGIKAGVLKKTGPMDWMSSSLFGMVAIPCLRVIMEEQPIPVGEISQFIMTQYTEGVIQR